MRQNAWKVLMSVCLCVCCQLSAGKVAQVGKVTLELPRLKGFAQVSDLDDAYLTRAKGMMPDVMQVREIYVDQAETADLKAGKADGFKRYMILGTVQGETEKLTTEDFAAIKVMMRKEFDSFSPEKRKELTQWINDKQRKVGDPTVSVDISRIVPYSVDMDSERIFSQTLISKMQVRGKGGTENRVQVMTASMFLVRDRLMFLYVFSLLNTPQDIQWAQQQTKTSLGEIQRVNGMTGNK